MTWEPISEGELQVLINSAESEMEPALLAYWKRIRIRPAKWALPPLGDVGGGFWVVAVIGQRCVWYNDIEDGFNVSQFSTSGLIDEYWCNQCALRESLYAMQAELEGRAVWKAGPPEPLGEY